MNSIIPEKGQLVLVRNRPAIVRDILKAKTENKKEYHGIWIDYIDSFSICKSEYIVWEVEHNTRIISKANLPRISESTDIDDPAYFDCYLNSIRWSSIVNIDSIASYSPASFKLISPWYSAVQIEEYQLYPVVKALSMPRITMLLADDVGLGKTIEAGLIINELIARGRLNRILILCPASLQIQWKDEMDEKFYLDFNVLNRDTVFKHQKEFGLDSNPWSSSPRIITSIDYLRQSDVLENFRSASDSFIKEHESSLPWDLIIIDEAHNISSRCYGEETERLKMVKQVLPYFENRLFLTATPHNGYTESFSGLLELLNPLVFEQKRVLEESDFEFIQNYVVRRLKSDFIDKGLINKFKKRFILPIDDAYVQNKLEKELYNALRAYKDQVMAFVKEGPPKLKLIAKFLITILTKRLLSSVYAFAYTWWNHFSGFELESADEAEVDLAMRRVDEDITDDGEKAIREDDAVRKIGSFLFQQRDAFREEIDTINNLLNDIGWEQKNFEKSLSTTKKIPDDSKFTAFFEWMEANLKSGKKFKDDERVIVFTEYKHTLDYLLSKLKEIGLDEPVVGTLFGGTKQSDRNDIKTYFNDPESPLRILAVTDAASEGLNLQQNCRFIIHFDIPWNPIRLEQRNGRVDRFGQNRDVKIFHFVSKEEEDLLFLERIINKINKIREDLGSVGELIDNNIEKYFMGSSESRKEAESDIDALEHSVIVNEDMSKISQVDFKEYTNAYQILKTTEEELLLTPQHLAKIVQEAFLHEGGKLSQHPDDEKVYLIDIIPPRWQNIINDTLIIKKGRLTGAKYKLVFDPAYFEKVENDLKIYLSKPDTRLIRLGHPIVQLSLDLFKRKMWDTTELIDNSSVLRRFTIQHTTFPTDYEMIVVLYCLVAANNDLRETIHKQVIEIPGYLFDGKFNPIAPELWRTIKGHEKSKLTSAQLTTWFNKIKNLWITSENSVTELLAEKSKELQSSMITQLKALLTSEKKAAKELYENRINELREKRKGKFIEKLKKQIETERTKLLQQTIFEDVTKERKDKLRALEIDLEKVITERVAYLENIITSDKTKMLEMVIPKKYKLAYFNLYPVGVEFILNSNLLK